MNSNKNTSLQIHKALLSDKSSVIVDGVSYSIKTSRNSRFVKINETVFLHIKKQMKKYSPSLQASNALTYVIKPGRAWGQISNTNVIPLQEEQK